MGDRDYSVVAFHMGPEEEDCGHAELFLEFVPRVGDEVNFWTHRDEDGNYLNSDKKIGDSQIRRHVIHGIVERIRHSIEERGRNERELSILQYIHVYLRPLPIEPIAWCPKCRLYSCGCKGVGIKKTVREIMGGEK